MKRRFVIAVEGFTATQDVALRDYLASKGAWWHWIDNFWLLTTNRSDVSVEEIRDQLKTIKNDVDSAVVFEFPEDITWASFARKNAAGKVMTAWLKDSWAKE
jgi:hypothetical protein